MDALFARVGDGMAAVTVLVGVRMLGLSTPVFFGINLVLIGLWLLLCLSIVRGHRVLSERASGAVDA